MVLVERNKLNGRNISLNRSPNGDFIPFLVAFCFFSNLNSEGKGKRISSIAPHQSFLYQNQLDCGSLNILNYLQRVAWLSWVLGFTIIIFE